MGNETILKFGAPKLLEGSGAAIANDAVVGASEIYDVAEDGGCYPDARFAVRFQYGYAPQEGSLLSLYAQPLDVLGGDSQVPESSRPTAFIGSFVVDNVTSTQYAEMIARDVPWKARYFLHNSHSWQSVLAGWGLEVTPFTLAPAE